MADSYPSLAAIPRPEPPQDEHDAARSDVWMDDGILRSTAKRRGYHGTDPPEEPSWRFRSPSGAHRSGSWRRSGSPRAGPYPPSRRDRPENRFGSLYTRAPDEYRHHRFGDKKPDEDRRPAQRLGLLRSSDEEECTDPSELAIAEGRRIYLGNLSYAVKPDEIEAFIKNNGCAEGYSNIYISIDPFTGRNPSYCFVEFSERAAADNAMDVLNGRTLKNRPVKCKPCHAKGRTLAGRRPTGDNNAFYRWGNWAGDQKGSSSAARDGSAKDGPDIQGPYETLNRYANRQSIQGRRLFVGNLPRMHDQAMAYDEMITFFAGFKVEAVSKRYSPPERKKDDDRGNWQHVDFATHDEAAAALRAMRDQTWRGARVRLDWAKARD